MEVEEELKELLKNISTWKAQTKRKKEKKAKGKELQEVEEGFLYLGNAKAAKNKELLQQYQITHIVCLAGKQWHPSLFTYLKVHLADDASDDTSLLPLLPSIIKFIEEVKEREGRRVMVHCMGGISRSPSAILAYLIYAHHLSLSSAYQMLLNKCPSIHPNPSFLSQLLLFSSSLNPSSLPCNINNNNNNNNDDDNNNNLDNINSDDKNDNHINITNQNEVIDIL